MPYRGFPFDCAHVLAGTLCLTIILSQIFCVFLLWYVADLMMPFRTTKRKGAFKTWEPFFIGTHADPLFDERLTYEGRADKMTQVRDRSKVSQS